MSRLGVVFSTPASRQDFMIRRLKVMIENDSVSVFQEKSSPSFNLLNPRWPGIMCINRSIFTRVSRKNTIWSGYWKQSFLNLIRFNR